MILLGVFVAISTSVVIVYSAFNHDQGTNSTTTREFSFAYFAILIIVELFESNALAIL